jgi:alpha-beta hydrolase superfamily lysophospholipase
MLFFFQEKLIFFPEKLDKDFQFSFAEKFEEIEFQSEDNKSLHGVLFKAGRSKGLVFYLHGNAGSINSWGEIAKTYTELDHDVFLFDYRGYGKSEGSITSQEQLFRDLQVVYNEVAGRYAEDNIIVLGYSIGTAPAAKLASTNNPKLLILQAPYYSLTDMMRHNYRIFPTFLLKYKFRTDQFIRDCKMPVVIFHGDKDEVIYYRSSLKLKDLMKVTDTLITLKGQGHNGMTENPDYKIEIQKVLSFYNGKSNQEELNQ